MSRAIIAGTLHGLEEAVAIADIHMRETPALNEHPILHHGPFSTSAGRHIGTGGDSPPRVRAVFNLLRD